VAKKKNEKVTVAQAGALDFRLVKKRFCRPRLSVGEEKRVATAPDLGREGRQEGRGD